MRCDVWHYQKNLTAPKDLRGNKAPISTGQSLSTIEILGRASHDKIILTGMKNMRLDN